MNYIKPRGTEDIYEDINFIKWIENKLINCAKLYGFSEIRTPSFENKNLYVLSIGKNTDIISKEMFLLKTKSKNEYVLKPEGTASIVRFLIENKLYNKKPLPLKFFYLQNMYRYERPQKGRMRQFYQFGVEIIGNNSSIIDIEAIIFADHILKVLNIKKYLICINSLGTENDRNKYIKALTEALKKISKCDDCNKRIKHNPLRVLDCKIDKFDNNKLPKMYDFLSKSEKDNLEFIIQKLIKFNVKVKLDHKLVRGLDYYTNIVFEIKSTETSNENFTLIGGGRYNNLIKILGGADIPAFGFAIGIERIRIILDSYKKNIIDNDKVDVYFITLSNIAKLTALKLAKKLRNNNISVLINFDDINIKKQFKITEKIMPKNIIIIGDKEVTEKKISIKNTSTKKIITLKFEDILTYFRKDK